MQRVKYNAREIDSGRETGKETGRTIPSKTDVQREGRERKRQR